MSSILVGYITHMVAFLCAHLVLELCAMALCELRVENYHAADKWYWKRNY